MPEALRDETAARSLPDRRFFLRALGSGLLVVLTADENTAAQESGHHHRVDSEDLPQNVSAWLHIGPDGSITAYTGKAEVGQNIRTSLAQAVADELRCSPSAVNLVMADTARTPWDMGTFGSRTTPTMAPQLRKRASTARELLIGAAAQKWSVDGHGLSVANGCVKNPATGTTARFGELTSRIDWVKSVGQGGLVTSPAKWQVAGKSLAKVNAREIVSGKHRYTSDIERGAMLYGRVLRPPSFGAKLESLDAAAAQHMPGVAVIRDGDFAGVTAPDEHIAQKALESLKANWEENSGEPSVSARDVFAYLKQHPAEASDSWGHNSTARGSIKEGLQAAQKTLKATYTVDYIAHVPLEPRAAVAEWNGSGLTVWTGTQRPFGVRSELAQAFAIPEGQVRVIVPDTGGAYGGKHTGECAIEAARLAKAAGKPVKLIWTREEEFTWAYFRPGGLIEITSGASKDGVLTAWEFHNFNSGPSGIEAPYEVANQIIEYHPAKSPLRQGSYRGLAATANHFARESHMDEVAAALGMDPLEFRLKNLKNPRICAVLQAATDSFGWRKTEARHGHGFGLACGTEKGSYFACCAEISVSATREVRMERVVQAFECGAIVNPKHLENQVEGAIAMGIGGALFETIDFANRRILNPRLSSYRLPRFSDMPKIEIILLDRKDLPSAGAGETPIMGIAPAIGNAIYNAAGVRVRSMPMLPALAKA
ncbi:MAG: xanthine dehydrogenase family protein molybdopterin-binding subunit [Acidobacteriaceae bacterium]|nr:xanthine dehydrogenase family protein molybdopterin-binding subunit [Acidobacteriaceae bacterium]MBV9782168.1 xanthine dehydrogenase family protein molybdopterin-binding subunit [Acidobacteriaceae bacterium]